MAIAPSVGIEIAGTDHAGGSMGSSRQRLSEASWCVSSDVLEGGGDGTETKIRYQKTQMDVHWN